MERTHVFGERKAKLVVLGRVGWPKGVMQAKRSNASEGVRFYRPRSSNRTRLSTYACLAFHAQEKTSAS